MIYLILICLNYTVNRDTALLLIRNRNLTTPLLASLVLAAFATSQGLIKHVFDLEVKTDPNVPLPKYEKPLRYRKMEAINHIVKADPKSDLRSFRYFSSLLSWLL